MIAFHRWEAGSFNIFTYSLLDETIRRVTRLDSDDWITNASPDGSWLAFWVLESETESIYYNRGSLYIICPDGRDLVKISDKLHTLYEFFYKPVHWTPDSKYLVFNEVEGYSKRFLTVYDIDKGQRKRITPTGYYPYTIMLITNDGWIFSEEYVEPVTIGVLKVKIDGSEIKKLRFTEDCIEFHCARYWAYDPSYDIIAFTDSIGQNNIATINASNPNGDAFTTLLELDLSNYVNQERERNQYIPFINMQWSPDGNYLFMPISNSEAYIWEKSTNSTIRIPEELILDHGEETGWVYNWSPDSLSIFFLKFKNEMFSTTSEKYIYKVSTGEIKVIEGLVEEDVFAPVWIP